jgi:hypothetical protein
MMPEKNFTCVLLTCFFLFIFSGSLFSQEQATNNSFYTKAFENSTAVYHQSFGEQSAIYNGPLYNGYPFTFKEGQPYFHSEEITFGTVVYEGIQYDSILMKYDEITDVLIIFNSADQIQLWNERVESFHIFNADFIQPQKDSNVSGLGFPGFYNLLYNGKNSLLKKEIKVIREQISATGDLQRFTDTKEYYYVKKNGTCYAVPNSKSFYKILGEHKDEVKQFVKTNKLSFRKDRQNTLIKATAYYDSLK